MVGLGCSDELQLQRLKLPQWHTFSLVQTIHLTGSWYINLINQGEARENSTLEAPKLRERDKD